VKTAADHARELGILDRCTTKDGKPLDSASAKAEKPSDNMNKTERLYAWNLENDLKAGFITAWFRENISMVVIDTPQGKVRYRPDFMIVHLDGSIEFIEIKGFLRDDSRKTFLAAVAKYTFWKFTMLRRHKGAWERVM
jgi:hypothetical protein